ncbi:CAP domain-containing protein [Patescibacteria group bacterium]
MKSSSNKKRRLHHRAKKHLHHFFIPHEGNNYHPHSIRRPSLRIYSAILIFSKIFLAVFLFLLYPSPAQFSSLSTSNIVSLTNSSRAEANLGALSVSSQLTSAAEAKANDMLARDYFAHTTPDGKPFYKWVQEAGYSYSLSGENLALDFSSAESAHNALMASTSHRDNILNPKFKNIGLAVVSGDFNGRDTFVLVELFGNPYQEPVPEPEPEPVPEPEPEPVPTEITQVPEAPQLAAKFVSQSDDSIDVILGQEAAFVINYQNVGELEWTNDGEKRIDVNLADPADRTSLFIHQDWLNASQPTSLIEESVVTDDTGTFRLPLQAPEILGTFSESFSLVDNSKSQIEGGQFTIPVRVHNPILTITRSLASTVEFQNEPVLLYSAEELNRLLSTNSELQTGQVLASEDSPQQAINIANTIFWAIFIFLVIVLVFNLLVEVRVQHSHAIFHTVLVLIMAGLMLAVKLHFVENLPTMMQIV